MMATASTPPSPSFHQFSGTKDFIASAQLSEAVNVALALQKPLLIKGEPGTGKTVLAEAVASSLGRELISWHIKSTTKAQDGLYLYDTVQRLNDARFGEGDVKDVRRYIKWGPLGRSFRSEQATVVLVDEIDKADLEFPNDLLHELDRMSFQVLETGDLIQATLRPLVIITSNNEKELPDPFLRRCVFHYIEFPDADLMKNIVDVHHPKVSETLVAQAIKAFYGLRKAQGLRKLPSTSELIDWIAVLDASGIDLNAAETELPFIGTLLKHEQDQASAKRAAFRTRRNDPDRGGH